MKTVASILIILALVALLAHIVLPRGSYPNLKVTEKPERLVGKAVSSRATVEGVEAAKMPGARNGRDDFSPIRK